MRKSTRIKRSVVPASTTNESREEENDSLSNSKKTEGAKAKTTPNKKTSPKKKATPKSRMKTESNDVPDNENVISSEEEEKKRKRKQNQAKSLTASSKKENKDEEETSGKKRKKACHQRVTGRDPIPKLWNEEEAYASKGSYS